MSNTQKGSLTENIHLAISLALTSIYSVYTQQIQFSRAISLCEMRDFHGGGNTLNKKAAGSSKAMVTKTQQTAIYEYKCYNIAL